VSVELNLVKGADLAPGLFLQRWHYFRRSETVGVKRSAELASKKQARLHVLTINDIDYGFVTVGIHHRKNQKLYHVQVIYLFVSAQFRKKKIDELEGMLASEYMMGHVISKSLQTSKFFPFSSIMLETASDRLFPLYESLEFSRLPDMTEWMSLPLPH
jgi:hypothetical protein